MKRILAFIVDAVAYLGLTAGAFAGLEKFILAKSSGKMLFLGFLDQLMSEKTLDLFLVKRFFSAHTLPAIVAMVVVLVLYLGICRILFKKTLGQAIFGVK